jgi:hypothetical protein
MSRKPSFANLRTAASASKMPVADLSRTQVAPQSDETERLPKASAAARPESRVGRKQIAGFFTPEMSFAMHMLARRQGRSLQSLMAEAFNDVLRKHGESPIGE